MTPPPNRDTIYQSSCGSTNDRCIMIFVRAVSESGYLRQRLVRGGGQRMAKKHSVSPAAVQVVLAALGSGGGRLAHTDLPRVAV
jgi:hypothetical protein